MQHALDKIAAGALVAVGSDKQAEAARQIRVVTRDYTIAGTTLAAEVLAFAKGNTRKWHYFACCVIGMKPEARSAFMNAIKAEKSALTKEQVKFGVPEKEAADRTSSFAVQISRLTTIARHFNGAATLQGLCNYLNGAVLPEHREMDPTIALANAGFVAIYNYAKQFNGAQARRTKDTWTAKFGKWLERNVPGEDAPDADITNHKAAVLLYNRMVTK